jgi:hypothetical protein
MPAVRRRIIEPFPHSARRAECGKNDSGEVVAAGVTARFYRAFKAVDGGLENAAVPNMQG